MATFRLISITGQIATMCSLSSIYATNDYGESGRLDDREALSRRYRQYTCPLRMKKIWDKDNI